MKGGSRNWGVRQHDPRNLAHERDTLTPVLATDSCSHHKAFSKAGVRHFRVLIVAIAVNTRKSKLRHLSAAAPDLRPRTSHASFLLSKWNAPRLLADQASKTVQSMKPKRREPIHLLRDGSRIEKRGEKMDAVSKIWDQKSLDYINGHVVMATILFLFDAPEPSVDHPMGQRIDCRHSLQPLREPRLVRQPQLIVFDLDFTLWDCGGTWCDCLSPPFSRQASRVVDRHGKRIRLYDDVESVLDRCDDEGIPMALASRTEQPPWARQLIELLGIADRFHFQEIYPSSKLRHFDALNQSSAIAFADMVFFDDEMRNIREVSTLGVQCEFVEDGLNETLFDQAMARYAGSY